MLSRNAIFTFTTFQPTLYSRKHCRVPPPSQLLGASKAAICGSGFRSLVRVFAGPHRRGWPIRTEMQATFQETERIRPSFRFQWRKTRANFERLRLINAPLLMGQGSNFSCAHVAVGLRLLKQARVQNVLWREL